MESKVEESQILKAKLVAGASYHGEEVSRQMEKQNLLTSILSEKQTERIASERA